MQLQLNEALPSDFVLELDFDDVALVEKQAGGLQASVRERQGRSGRWYEGSPKGGRALGLGLCHPASQA